MNDTPDKSGFPTAVVKSGGARAAARPSNAPPSLDAAWIEAIPDAHLFLKQRRRRRRWLLAQFALVVALPTLATFGYYYVLASPRCTVEFQASYQTFQAPQSLAAGLAQSASGTSVNNAVDLGTVLYQYIRSPALLTRLDRDLNLRAHYSDAKIDYLSRLPANASQDAFLRYFRNRVAATEGFGGYVQVDVEAFDAGYAQRLADSILKASGEMLEDMTSKVREAEVQLAEAEVARQETRIRAARKALTDFQNAHGDLDPNRGATQLGDIVGALETSLATARAQLAAEGNLSPTSPIVTGLRAQIASLEAQLRAERDRLGGTDKKTPYSDILDQYSALQLDQEFAKTAYSAAQQGLSLARFDALRARNSLAIFAPPARTDATRLASAALRALTTFIVAALLLIGGKLILAAFRDQSGA